MKKYTLAALVNVSLSLISVAALAGGGSDQGFPNPFPRPPTILMTATCYYQFGQTTQSFQLGVHLNHDGTLDEGRTMQTGTAFPTAANPLNIGYVDDWHHERMVDPVRELRASPDLSAINTLFIDGTMLLLRRNSTATYAYVISKANRSLSGVCSVRSERE